MPQINHQLSTMDKEESGLWINYGGTHGSGFLKLQSMIKNVIITTLYDIFDQDQPRFNNPPDGDNIVEQNGLRSYPRHYYNNHLLKILFV